jgi:hypothetical protein
LDLETKGRFSITEAAFLLSPNPDSKYISFKKNG